MLVWAFVVVAGALALAVGVFLACWQVAEPNEARLVIGWDPWASVRARRTGVPAMVGAGDSYRIVCGGGAFVVPGVQRVRRLALHQRVAEVDLEAVTVQALPVQIRAVVLYRVGDDDVSIVNAARRFLDQQGAMDDRMAHLLHGHLRSILGHLTLEELVRDRDRVRDEVRASVGLEFERLGLVVDALELLDVRDPSGYLVNLAAGHRADIERGARIAVAECDREAFVAECVAHADKVEAWRDAQLRTAACWAQVAAATAVAGQAGPLATAVARQAVVTQEAETARLEAEREDRRLDAGVRRPADAAAYAQVTLARAERDARIHHAEADARDIVLDAEAWAYAVRAGADAKSHRIRRLAATDADALRLIAAARADEIRQVGQAEADVVAAKGRADGEARRAVGLAAAAGIRARSEALAAHADAVIGQSLAARWPEIVRAAAAPFGAIDQLIVLGPSTTSPAGAAAVTTRERLADVVPLFPAA